MESLYSLHQLGWRPFFQQQLHLEQWEYPVARVIAQHRNRLELLGEAGERSLDLYPGMPEITVGDWLVLSPEGDFDKLLERQSLFRRKAAGSKVGEQLIAAYNIGNRQIGFILQAGCEAYKKFGHRGSQRDNGQANGQG